MGWKSGLAIATLSWAIPRQAGADDLALPPQVEAKLSSNVAAYDRSLPTRAGEKVVIAIVARASDPSSTRAASQLQGAFHDVNDMGGLPHEEFILLWKDGSTLADACAQRKAAVVFLTPGLAPDIEAVVRGLKNLHVLSIAGDLSYVEKGVVLGFDLVSGRPQIVINLSAAKSQGLAFRASLLKLAKVIE